MQAVILAAGKGTRIKTLSKRRSKAMLPILGKPVIERSIEHLASNGLTDFIIVITPHDRITPRYFQQDCGLNLDIRFVYQSSPLGTADALSCAIPLIEGDFFLAACDNLTSPDHIAHMLRLWNANLELNGLLTLLQVEQDEVSKTGIVTLDGNEILGITEKPSREEAGSNIASIPLYCFSREILEFTNQVPLSRRGEYEIQSAIQTLVEQRGKVEGIFVENRISITSPADLLAANQQYLLSGFENPQIQPQDVGRGTHLVSPLYIERGVRIGDDCVIGPNVYIECDCHIGDNVKIKDSVVLKETSIPPQADLVNTIIS